MDPIFDFIDLTEDTDMEDAEPPQTQPQTNGHAKDQTNGQTNHESQTNGFVKLDPSQTPSLTPPKEIANLGSATFSSTLVVSPSLPTKRKSSELDSHEQRPLRVTPPQPKLPTDPPMSVSVVVPSPPPDFTHQYHKVQPKFTGISEQFFPTKSAQLAEESMRRYAVNKATTKRSFVSLSADVGDRHGRNRDQDQDQGQYSNSRSNSSSISSSEDQDLESIQRASVARLLDRLNSDGPEISFNIDKNNLHKLVSSNFGFIQDYILRDGVERVAEEFNAGCSCPGGVCEPTKCSCLATEKDSDELIVPYQLEKRALRPDFLERKSMIYECNHRCGCRGNCWFNVVQRGRIFRLEIFHTGNRGFGLRSPDNIQIGDFIDCYLGEVLTKEESDEREDDQQVSYLFGLDFLVDDLNFFEEDMYVVDGRKFGNATRFMNHSCNPNCKIIPVSIDHGDARLHYLAFFARRDIPAGEELTFDYNPGFDAREKQAAGAVKCLCGDVKCRGQLWPNARKQQHRSASVDVDVEVDGDVDSGSEE